MSAGYKGQTGIMTVRSSSPSSAWRGLSLTFEGAGSSGLFDYSDGDYHQIPYDVVVADTDGIADANGGGTVPTGMAGLWRMAAQVDIVVFGGEGGVGVIAISVNGEPFGPGTTIEQWYQAGSGGVYDNVSASLAACVAVLAEGDAVGVWAGNSGTTNAQVTGVVTRFLMEYLGPA